MEYRYCGASGLMLSRVALGFWQNFGWSKAHDVPCLVYQGLLTDRYLCGIPEDSRIRRDEVTSVIVGASSVEQL